MSKYDPNGQDIDDLLRQVDSLLDEEPGEDWFDDKPEDEIDPDDYTPAEAVTDDTQIFYQNYSNNYGRQVRNYRNGYGGQEKPPEPIRSEPSIPAYNADFQQPKRNSQARKAQNRHQQTEYPSYDEPAARKHRGKSRKGCGCLPTLILMAVAVVGLCFWLFQQPKSDVPIGERKPDTATILICGADIGNGRDNSNGTRTDTMMLLYLSGSERTAGLLSLPRDTYTITSAGNAAKLNSAYGRNGTGQEGMEGLLDYVQDIIGYRPDGYILVDMTLVSEIANLMGGVDIEVPQAMELDGFSLEAGMQHLDGQGILTMLRFRKGYATADLGRVEVQRNVIKTCMDQWLSVSNVTKLPEALSLMQRNSISNLSTRNYLWIAKTLLTSMSGDFSTETLPGYADYVGSASYYILNRDEVARLVNDSYNPYEVTISPEDLNIAG